MSQFRDGVARLIARTEREVLALFGRYSRNEIGREQFVSLAAAVLARARAQGVALADLALTAQAIRVLRQSAAPSGITPPEDDFDRLHESVGTVLGEEIDYAEDREQLLRSQGLRLGRLSRDSAAEAAVWGMGIAMLARGISGWVRETDADPCIVCQNLADGVVRSPSVVMKRHTGCACVQSAVFN